MVIFCLFIIFCGLALVIKIYFKLTFGRCKSNVCLAGKTALVTGGNSGIGYQVALALAGRGCRIIIADKANCKKSKEYIINETGNCNIVTKSFDLTSLASIRALAKDLNESEERLDILINNAGIFGGGSSCTEDGLNTQMQVNHFGPFLLTYLLVGLLKESAPSRIIFVSSLAAYRSKMVLEDLNGITTTRGSFYNAVQLYGNSKLCSIITSNRFSEILKPAKVTVNSLHPGVVHTSVLRTFYDSVENYSFYNKVLDWLMHFTFKYFCKNAEEGAQTALHVALAKELENVTGKFFSDCQECKMPELARDQLFSKQIWDASEDFVKLKSEERLTRQI